MKQIDMPVVLFMQLVGDGQKIFGSIGGVERCFSVKIDQRVVDTSIHKYVSWLALHLDGDYLPSMECTLIGATRVPHTAHHRRDQASGFAVASFIHSLVLLLSFGIVLVPHLKELESSGRTKINS